MEYCVVSVKDRAVEAFGRPVFVAAIGAAIRSFQDEINNSSREDNMMAKHPDDFDLYYLGTFDDSSGRFALLDTPKQLALGKQMVHP